MLLCCYVATSTHKVALVGAISVIFESTKLRFVGHEVTALSY